MKLKNLTPFPVATTVTSRQPPQPEMVLVVRGRFRIVPGGVMEVDGDGELDLMRQGSLSAETFHDDDDDRAGECLQPNDLADFKLNAEVLLRGTCHVPGDAPQPQCLAKVELGAWSKELAVFGPRAWSDRRLGAIKSDPLPFEQMPLDYRHAFGGPGHAANPAGKGAEGDELPNVEDPARLITAPKDAPAPAGFGPINPEWPSRAGKRGTKYGADYEATRAPFYAEDFDWTYFHAAPDDQQLEGYLRGDETLRLTHLHPEQTTVATTLPKQRIRAFVKNDHAEIAELEMRLDTVFALPDEDAVLLTWRGLGPAREDDLHDIATVLVAAEPLGKREDAAHYHGLLEAFEADPLGFEEMGVPALEAKRDAELAKLDATMESLDGLGEGEDEEVGGKVADLVTTLHDDPPPDTKAGIVGGFDELVKKQREQQPDGPGLAALMRRGATQPKGSPPPLRVPSSGGAPGFRAPEVVAELEKARDQVAKGQADLAKSPAGLDEAPDPSAEIDKVLEMPMVAGLRGRPPVEPAPDADLAEQDYRDRDLREADMHGANLTEALLARADLRGANLAGADLSYAVLHEAQLEGADLSGCRLTLTNFSKAQAAGAKLVGAIVDRTLFEGTDLSGADLSGLSGGFALFIDTRLEGAKLVKARLNETLFSRVNGERLDASEAELRQCAWLEAKLENSVFTGADLSKTSFKGAEAAGASFCEARGERVVFMEMTLDDADFSYAVLPGAFFNEASARRARFFGANLEQARLYRCQLDEAVMEHANLLGCDLRKASLHNADLRRANLYDASLVGAFGKDCRFEGANLTRARLPR